MLAIVYRNTTCMQKKDGRWCKSPCLARQPGSFVSAAGISDRALVRDESSEPFGDSDAAIRDSARGGGESVKSDGAVQRDSGRSLRNGGW